jgi:hypothetical protein
VIARMGPVSPCSSSAASLPRDGDGDGEPSSFGPAALPSVCVRELWADNR